MPKIRIHPLFILLLILLGITGKLLTFGNMIFSVLIHELAHGKVAKHRGYVLENMTLMPYGAVIAGKQSFSKDDALAIYLAGPLINAFFAIILIAVWWLVPEVYNYTRQLAYSNIVLCVFNLLPIFPLDGSKILINIVPNRLKMLAIMKVSGIIISLTLFIIFVITSFSDINVTLGIISIFLFAGAVSGSKKEKYHHISSNVPFVKNRENGLEKNEIIVLDTMPLYKLLKFIKPNVYNTFEVQDNKGKRITVLNEEDMRVIFENNDITTKLRTAILQ